MPRYTHVCYSTNQNICCTVFCAIMKWLQLSTQTLLHESTHSASKRRAAIDYGPCQLSRGVCRVVLDGVRFSSLHLKEHSLADRVPLHLGVRSCEGDHDGPTDNRKTLDATQVDLLLLGGGLWCHKEPARSAGSNRNAPVLDLMTDYSKRHGFVFV